MQKITQWLARFVVKTALLIIVLDLIFPLQLAKYLKVISKTCDLRSQKKASLTEEQFEQ